MGRALAQRFPLDVPITRPGRSPTFHRLDAGVASGHAPRSGWTRYSTRCLYSLQPRRWTAKRRDRARTAKPRATSGAEPSLMSVKTAKRTSSTSIWSL